MAGKTPGVRHPLAWAMEGHRLILGSKSPRRVALLEELGLEFEVRPSDADESHPDDVNPTTLPLILAKRKAEALIGTLAETDILITADTIVALEGRVLEKPGTIDRARSFLRELSGKWHTVYTGYCVRMGRKEIDGTVETKIHFCPLTSREIDYYLSRCEVLDKAGAYGIQDWIGLMAADEVRGSYNNVIGLPTSYIYRAIAELTGVK